MKKRMGLYLVMLLVGLGVLLAPAKPVAAETTVMIDSTFTTATDNIRNYTATGSNALYTKPGVLKDAVQVASGSTLAAYNTDKGQGLLRAYRWARLSNGSYYMNVVTFDGAYDGWIYVGKSSPINDLTRVAGGLKYVETTQASALTDQEKTHQYTFRQVGPVDKNDDGAMATYSAPKWTQYDVESKMTDSTPYAGDQLSIKSAITRTREGDRWVYVKDETIPSASGWIRDSALVLLGRLTINYQDKLGQTLYESTTMTDQVGVQYDVSPLTIPGYEYVGMSDASASKLGRYEEDPLSITFVYAPVTAGYVTVNYVDANGKKIATTKVITGEIGDTYKTEKVTIPGYHYVSVEGESTGKIGSQNVTVTYHYKKTASSTTVTPTPSTPTPNVPVETPTNDSVATDADMATAINRVAVKGQAIYSIRTVGLYRNAQFNQRNRIKVYQKAKRINRPEFIVKGYQRDKAGHLRYRVQQYNPYTKRYIKGTVGYLTASSKYVVSAYYATKPKNRKIRVINPKGLYEYKQYSLAGKRGKHVKVGAVMKVTQIRRYKYTTRYRLTNGQFVTANKKFVIFES